MYRDVKWFVRIFTCCYVNELLKDIISDNIFYFPL